MGAACAGRPSTPAGPLVPLRALAPHVEQEIRYAGADNFVGAPVDGYEAPVCLLTEAAARALAGAQARLEERGLGLRVFDCYRPRRAVAHFLRWAADPADDATRARHYPFVPKHELVERGYIAESSSHSRGSAVDVTLVERPPEGGPGTPLDMGTPFDFFDPRSATDSREVSARARANRRLLRQAMAAAGFRHLPEEWWHYSLAEEPFPDTAFDVPVR